MWNVKLCNFDQIMLQWAQYITFVTKTSPFKLQFYFHIDN